MKFEVEVKINRPHEIVYPAYIDPDNMLKWSTDLEQFEVVEGKFGEIGSHARLHYNENGRKSILDDRLIEFDPGKRIVSSVTGNGLIARVETVFSILAPDQIKISLTWKGTSKKLPVKLALTLLRNKIRKRTYNELVKFKQLVEKYGVKFQ